MHCVAPPSLRLRKTRSRPGLLPRHCTVSTIERRLQRDIWSRTLIGMCTSRASSAAWRGARAALVGPRTRQALRMRARPSVRTDALSQIRERSSDPCDTVARARSRSSRGTRRRGCARDANSALYEEGDASAGRSNAVRIDPPAPRGVQQLGLIRRSRTDATHIDRPPPCRPRRSETSAAAVLT